MVHNRKAILLIVAGILSAVFSACSGIFYSSLGEDEIRATAYDIATTSLATTVEVTINSPATAGPGEPDATLDPTFCPDDELDTWREFALANIQSLDEDLQVLAVEEIDSSQLEEILPRADSQIFAVLGTPHPRCADRASRRLSNVYEELVDTIEALLAGNRATIPFEKSELLDAMERLFKELRILFSDTDVKEFEEILSEYTQ